MNFEKLTGLGIGSWGFGEDPKKKKDEIAAIRYGLDHGLSVIDTAEMYGDGQSEELIGEAIKGYDREKLFLISKFYPYHATPKLERQSLEASLKRLGTDHLDLYLLHWRGSHRLSDTIRGLQALQKDGFGVYPTLIRLICRSFLQCQVEKNALLMKTYTISVNVGQNLICKLGKKSTV